MSADEIIAKQLAKAAFGWMGTARHLLGPSLCRSNAFRTGGLRASSASLFHFWLIRLMSFSRWICTFQAAREHVLKIPLTPYPYSSPCCTKLFSRFQKFQQFRQNSILFVVQCHERNAEFFGCFPFAAVFEEKHINELTIIL